jgi:hypothetical protein
MKNVISFCLWGDDLKYTLGAVKNCDLAEKYFPDWICRFYVGSDVPEYILLQIQKQNNTEIIRMSEPCDRTGMFWRFLAASDPDVHAMLSRDTDCRLCAREAAAVNEWMDSDKDFHIIRDHPYHGTAIMGGLWGVKNGLLSNMKEMVDEYEKGDFWQVDQNFLREKVYNNIQHSVLVHDPFFDKKPFPVERDYGSSVRFIGEVFDEHDRYNPEDIEVLAKAEGKSYEK